MEVVAVKTYAEFKKLIPAKFRTPGKKGDPNPHYDEFRRTVGREASRFRTNYLKGAFADLDRQKRWSEWLGKIKFDDFAPIVDKIDDDLVNDMGQGRGEADFAIAIYYRFHSHLVDLDYAKNVDRLVFQEPLYNRGVVVFERESVIEKLLTIDTKTSDLHYSKPITKIWGRDKEQKKLRKFLKADENFYWLQLAGAGGQGKSRLAYDLVMECRKDGKWSAGFLNEDNIIKFASLVEEWRPEKPTLIVIDYILGREKYVREIFRALCSRHEELVPKVRLLLVERQPWNRGALEWTDLEPEKATSEFQITPSIRGHSRWFEELGDPEDSNTTDKKFQDGIIVLEELDSDDLISVFYAAVRFFRVELDIVDDDVVLSRNEIERLLQRIDTHGRPLFAYLLARAILLGGVSPDWRHGDLLDEVIRRDQKWRWNKVPDFAGTVPKKGSDHLCMRLALLANMAGGVDCVELVRRGTLGKIDPGAVRQAVVLNDGHLGVSPDEESLVPRLQPDILGEWFVLSSFDSYAGSHLRELVQTAWEISPRQMAVFETNCAADFPEHKKFIEIISIEPRTDESKEYFDSISTKLYNSLYERGVKNIPGSLIKSIERYAQHGDLLAKSIVGIFYLKGIHCKNDKKLGMKYLTESARGEEPSSLYNLGLCYFQGIGVDADLDKSTELMNKSAKLGFAAAHLFLARGNIPNILGKNQLRKFGEEIELGLYHYEEAAKLDHPIALYELSLFYGMGIVTKLDLNKSTAYCIRSAKLGYPRAMYGLAFKYKYGQGLRKDIKKYKYWEEKSIKYGYKGRKYIEDNIDDS